MKIVWLVLVSFMVFGGIPAQNALPSAEDNTLNPTKIRARLAGGDSIVVGQKVMLWVDVLTNTWFAQAPDFPEMRIAKAITLQLSQFGINFTERINGETWAVQRREYVVFPQRAGNYTVPSLEVKVSYAIPGRTPGKTTLTSPSLTFNVRIPPGAENIDSFVTTPNLSVEDTFDKDLQNLRVGDSLNRTITMVAEDSVGMLLPTLSFDQIEGIAIYPDPPQVSEQVIRGESTGKRIESVTYLFEKEGEYQLPALNIYWWDIKNKSLHKDELPVYHLSVKTNPDLEKEMLETLEKQIPTAGEGEEVREKSGFDISRLIQIVLALAVIVACCWLLLIPMIKRYVRWRKKRRQEKKESEAAYFKRFIRGCRQNDAKMAYNLLMAWLDRIYPSPGAATLTWLLGKTEDSQLKNQLNGLKEELFGKTAAGLNELSWSSRKLIKSVSRARDRLLKRKKSVLYPVLQKSLNP